MVWIRRVVAVYMVIAVLALPGVMAYFLVSGALNSKQTSELQIAQHAYDRGDFALATQQLRTYLKRQPGDDAALLLLGRSAFSAGLYSESLRAFKAIKPRSDADHAKLLEEMIRCHFAMGALDEALNEVTAAVDAELDTFDWLRYSLMIWHAKFDDFKIISWADTVVESGDFTFGELLIVSGLRTPFHDETLINVGGNDALMRRAYSAMRRGDAETAKDLLKRVISEEPNRATGIGWYGQLLAREGSPEFSSWHRSWAQHASDNVEVWLARAIAAHNADKQILAAECLEQVMLRDAFHVSAAELSAKVFPLLPAGERQRYSLPNSEALQRVATLLEELSHTPDVDMMHEVAEIFLELDQPRYARAWAVMASRMGSEDQWPSKIIAAAEAIETLNAGRRSRENRRPAPEFLWDQIRFEHERHETVKSAIRFRDVAKRVGIEFHYENGGDPEFLLGHILETTGGGIGVIDYERDGRLDLYLAQGGNRKRVAGSNEFYDSLFRLGGEKEFAEIGEHAGLIDPFFTQGVCVGDFNNDGFPDLYLCNAGGNRFYENMGDGTFEDVTLRTAAGGNEWSVSAAIADLNDDGLPDLYVVNYLDLQQVLESECLFNGPRACPPNQFKGTPDRVYLNMGNGEFRDISQSSGVAEHSGKGMGIVVASFDGGETTSIAVSNDGEPNFLFRNRHADESSIPRFNEIGLPTGIATDAGGMSQASMGMTIGDVTGDELPDLFLTNFYAERNTLYVQQSDDLFVDETRFRFPGEPSLHTLGFGTQMLDADLDGDLDLMVANGHVDRTDVTGEPDRMRPQLYINEGNHNFHLAEAPGLGKHFEDVALGRAVAKLDWNRDGLPDLAVSHLDRSFALLENTTPEHGHHLCLQLVGTSGSRDAIGATVTISIGDWSVTQQVTAGDGYEVTNEKTLIFGLGPRESADSIKVQWPGGTTQLLQRLPVDKCWLVIEGQEPAFALD